MSVRFTLSLEGSERSERGISLERNNLPRRVLSRISACLLDMGHWPQVTALSIPARAFRKRAERNSRLALPPSFANTHWQRGNFDLPFFSWLQSHAQSLPQSPVRAEQSQPHRHRRDSYALRDFLRRILQNIAQQTDLPQIRSKLLDGIRQMLAHLAPRKAFLRIFLRSGYIASQRLFTRAPRLFQRENFSVAPLPDYIDGCVRRDARHPGVQIVAGLVLAPVELLQPGYGLQERFLPDVFRFRGIARQPQRAQVQRWTVWKDQFRQRFAVALPGLQEEPRPGGTVQSDGCAAHGVVKIGSRSAKARRCVIYRKERTNDVR